MQIIRFGTQWESLLTLRGPSLGWIYRFQRATASPAKSDAGVKVGRGCNKAATAGHRGVYVCSAGGGGYVAVTYFISPPPPSKMLGLPLVSRPEAEVPCARVRVGIPLATTTSAPRNPFAGLKPLHLFFPRND